MYPCNGWGDGEPMVNKTGKAHGTHSWVMKMKSSYQATRCRSNSPNQHLSRDTGKNSPLQSALGKAIALLWLVGSPGLSQSQVSWAQPKVKSQVPSPRKADALGFGSVTHYFRELGCPEIQILDLPLIRPFDLGKDNFSKPQLPYLYNGNKSRKVVRIKWGVIQVNRVGCIIKKLTLFFNLSSLKQIWIRTGDYLVRSFRIMCPSPVSRSGEEWDSHWLLAGYPEEEGVVALVEGALFIAQSCSKQTGWFHYSSWSLSLDLPENTHLDYTDASQPPNRCKRWNKKKFQQTPCKSNASKNPILNSPSDHV